MSDSNKNLKNLLIYSKTTPVSYVEVRKPATQIVTSTHFVSGADLAKVAAYILHIDDCEVFPTAQRIISVCETKLKWEGQDWFGSFERNYPDAKAYLGVGKDICSKYFPHLF
jgi:hypothetical protein